MSRVRLFDGPENDAMLADWVAARITGLGFDGRGFEPCTCIGVLGDNRLIAAVVYHGWMPQWGQIQMSMAATDPRWARRGIILGLLAYPFAIGCRRISIMTRFDNTRVNRLVAGIGFIREGTHVDFFGPRENAISWRFRKKDYARLFRNFALGGMGVGDGEQQRQGRQLSKVA